MNLIRMVRDQIERTSNHGADDAAHAESFEGTCTEKEKN